ncbi:site-specific DNA-methyltransferase [Luteolibacter algae]|uniref:site-specific DNA-methyltransferase (adenine-specific) n=1 Tax=Luteolibacter algae TaxID=454151 RepID=A0ABW5D9H2_9BACT
MSHPRVPQELSQPITENLQKLAVLFPSAVKDGALDIEALREELGEFEEIRPGDEKYELNWVGKQAAKKEAFAPLLGKTLAFKPGESKDPETTENLYIEGDNLEALKLLRQNYFGEVKMIYIDPPYNTGNDFVYADKFKVSAEESEEEEGAVSAEGKRLIKNEKSSNRFHARWLDMMCPRLRIAKDLLREDGVIFISIDDNEVANLRALCDEVFEASNFVASVIWQKKYSTKADSLHFSESHDYILVYSRNIDKLRLTGLERTEKQLSIYKNPDDDPRGLWTSDNLLRTEVRDYAIFPIISPKTGEHFLPPAGSSWRYNKDKIKTLLLENRIWFGVNGDMRPRLKRFLSDVRSSIVPQTFWNFSEVGHSDSAKKELAKILDQAFFSTPKPVRLLHRIAHLSSDTRDLILDFFSGSATTAHAVMQINAEDGGKRRHIMVQLPEVCDEKSEAAKAGYKTIAEIGRERIRRAGEKVKEELRVKHAEWKKNLALAEKKGEAAPEESNPYVRDPDSLDIGFKAFRIEDTKINWIRKDLRGEDITYAAMTSQDALDFVPGYTDEDIVYEVMLRQSNIPLTQAITKPVPGANGKRTYLYGESYLISLEETVTKELIETLAALEPTPLKYFFRDSAFGKDIALKDETFRRLNAEIAKNHGDQGTAYTVEFI